MQRIQANKTRAHFFFKIQQIFVSEVDLVATAGVKVASLSLAESVGRFA